MLSVIMLNVAYISFLLSAIMLGVVAPFMLYINNLTEGSSEKVHRIIVFNENFVIIIIVCCFNISTLFKK